jgi:succinoglycan biosynthesis transport protein ExoP
MLQRNSDLPYVIPDEPPGRPAESWQYPTVDLREMGRILRRRYKMAVLPALTLLGLAVIYLLFTTTL